MAADREQANVRLQQDGTPGGPSRPAWSGRRLGKIVLRGAAGSGFAQAATAGVGLLTQIFLARVMGVHGYGVFVVVWTWAMLLGIPAKFGFQNSIVRFVAIYRADREWRELAGVLRTAFSVVTVLAIAMAILFSVSVHVLEDRLDLSETAALKVGSVLVVPIAILGVIHATLRAYRRPAVGQICLTGLPQLGILAIGSVIWLATGQLGPMQGVAIAVFSAFCAVLIGVKIVFATIDKDALSTEPAYKVGYWMRESFPLVFVAGLQLTMGQVDTIMIAAFADSEAAGLYAAALRLALLTSFGMTAVGAIVAPLIAEMYSRRDAAGLSRVLKLSALMVGAFTSFAVLFFLAVGEWALGIFGPAFTDAYGALMILVLGQAIGALLGPVGLLLTMTGHQRVVALVLGAAVLGNALLNFAMIPALGLEGAALATTIATVAWNLALFLYVRRTIGFTAWGLTDPDLWAKGSS